MPPYRRKAAMTFESYALYPHLTVFENIASPLRARRMDEAVGPQGCDGGRQGCCGSNSARSPPSAKSPAARSSARRWGARWWPKPDVFCSTSPSAIWMPRSAMNCAASSIRWKSCAGWQPCTSPMIMQRRCRWATASASWAMADWCRSALGARGLRAAEPTSSSRVISASPRSTTAVPGVEPRRRAHSAIACRQFRLCGRWGRNGRCWRAAGMMCWSASGRSIFASRMVARPDRSMMQGSKHSRRSARPVS